VSCAAWAIREGRPYPRSEVGRWRAVRGRLRTEEMAERSARQICPSRMSSWELLKRQSCKVKCLPINSPLMTRILRDCVSGEVERAVMRDAVVRFSSFQCLVKVREVLSSTPRTR
jgi:hypothetical protein